MAWDINPLAKAALEKLKKMEFSESEGGGPELPSWMSEKDYPPGTEPFVPPKNEPRQEAQQDVQQEEERQFTPQEQQEELNRKMANFDARRRQAMIDEAQQEGYSNFGRVVGQAASEHVKPYIEEAKRSTQEARAVNIKSAKARTGYNR